MTDAEELAVDGWDEMREYFADILLVMANVAEGDFEGRVHRDLPEGSPMAALYEGINEMIALLGRADIQRVAEQAELEQQVATIDIQRSAIRELSTPIIEVWDSVLCLPVVGVLDTTRSAMMTESLLSYIVRQRASCAIVDMTGIQVMDTGTADHFLRMARAVRLLGTQCLISGMSPSIAQTIVNLGVDLEGIATYRTLETALAAYVRETEEPPTFPERNKQP